MHYGFCPLVKFTFKDLAKLSALAAIFKTMRYLGFPVHSVLLSFTYSIIAMYFLESDMKTHSAMLVLVPLQL